ncbi:hypothetical protein B0H14DRAFT_2587716 [Mycena olivaceomarginata]|nr:hypothetical protein B0H14DRAFT_2587716 [Mycena olivaceomarginata]
MTSNKPPKSRAVRARDKNPPKPTKPRAKEPEFMFKPKDAMAAAELLREIVQHRPDLDVALPLGRCLRDFQAAMVQEVEVYDVFNQFETIPVIIPTFTDRSEGNLSARPDHPAYFNAALYRPTAAQHGVSESRTTNLPSLPLPPLFPKYRLTALCSAHFNSLFCLGLLAARWGTRRKGQGREGAEHRLLDEVQAWGCAGSHSTVQHRVKATRQAYVKMKERWIGRGGLLEESY